MRTRTVSSKNSNCIESEQKSECAHSGFYFMENQNFFGKSASEYKINKRGGKAMKHCKGILAGLSLVMAMPTVAYGAAAQPAKVSLEINGTDQTLQSVCNIGGNTYFQLRELASLMSKEMPFDVGWDASAQTILLEKGKAYTGSVPKISQTTQEAVATKTPVILSGESQTFDTYRIKGYTYFKLRDLADALGFSVAWDDAANKISVTTADISGQTPIAPEVYQDMLGHGMDVDWSKTNQGREYYTEKTAADFAAAGVDHVRIRIADDITPELLEGLDQQVEDCLEYGIIPIIAYQADDFKNDPSDKNMKKAVKWWKEMAEHFEDTSYLLSFDLLIEATDELNKDSERLNDYFAEAVTEIRKTNPERIIMISPRLRSDAAYLHELEIPEDHNGYLMAEWHFYAAGPSKTNEKKLWTTGTAEEKQLIQDKIQLALQWQAETGIPVWVGAWMPGDYNDGDNYSIGEQCVFAAYMTESLDEAGIPFAVNSDTKFYDREQQMWQEEMLPLRTLLFG